MVYFVIFTCNCPSLGIFVYYSVSIIVYIFKSFLSLGFNNHFSPVFNLLYFLTHRPILFYNLLILPVYILDFYHFFY